MGILLQVILINLIVSFDNIGVIAIAARGLDTKKANLARTLGIWLSLGLKLVFMLLVGLLFELEWLHIRLIGGGMLVFVIFSMLKDQKKPHAKPQTARFRTALLSIIIADISMSLDNVIAVLSLVADDFGNITAQGFSIAFLGFAISVPVLLIFSEAAINLINRYKAAQAAAAGYLGYVAAHMIFEDDLMLLVLRHFNFTYTTQLAIVLGLAVFGASYYWIRGIPSENPHA